MRASDPRREAARDFMRELLREAEIARIESLTPEQLEEEAKESGLAPGKALEMFRRAVAAADAPEAAPPAPAEPPTKSAEAPKARVVSLAERRRSLFPVLAAAAIVLLIIGLVWRNPMIHERIDAWFSPKPTPPIPTAPPVPTSHEETPKEKADRLREQAYVDIQKWYFDYAWNELQEAADLDPDGNKDPRVQQAYKDIQAGSPKPPVNLSKAPVAPWERPLQKQSPPPH